MEGFEDDAAVASTEKAMAEAGVPLTESGQVDYFAFDDTHRVMLPDGVQYIEHRTLNEGSKKKYQNLQNRDLIIQRTTGDAKMRMNPGDERHALLKSAICGWYLLRNGAEVPFTPRGVDEVLEKFPPKVIELVEKDVRLKNPWLMAEMELEDIDREIENLQTMRAAKVEADMGKSSSASK